MKGRYHIRKLIEKHGRKGNMSKWVSDLKADCPKRDATPATGSLRSNMSRSDEDYVGRLSKRNGRAALTQGEFGDCLRLLVPWRKMIGVPGQR